MGDLVRCLKYGPDYVGKIVGVVQAPHFNGMCEESSLNMTEWEEIDKKWAEMGKGVYLVHFDKPQYQWRVYPYMQTEKHYHWIVEFDLEAFF